MNYIQDSADRSEKRRKASRMIAFLFEDCGHEWTSLKEALPFIAEACEITITGKRKTQLLLECYQELVDAGITVPEHYVVPWELKKYAYVKHQSNAKQKDDPVRRFYDSWSWKKLSYKIRRERGNRCECCGAKPSKTNNVRIVADHIKSVRKHWHLRLNPKNIQVLCDDCNKGKSFQDETDWRT